MRKAYRVRLRHLQRLCSKNYISLLQWVRACEHNTPVVIDLNQAGHVRLSLVQSGRYTADLTFTQQGQHPLLGTTELRIRLYHDVRLAEVTKAQTCRQPEARNNYPNKAMHQPDEKYQWNRFLADWLQHLTRYGVPQSHHATALLRDFAS